MTSVPNHAQGEVMTSTTAEPIYGSTEFYAATFRRHAADHSDLIAVALIRAVVDRTDEGDQVGLIRNILAAAELVRAEGAR